MYRFKFYFKDGSTKIGSCWSRTSTGLFHDFDGLMDWDEYDSLSEKGMTTKKELKTAMECYKKLYKKEYYRIEIINDETNEVIDFIDTTNK